ncbi:M23 family metallopeptidase [Cytobacillus sp. IB215316]|uniref:M23 family metallopeptidase n=1 Tax=Cytobacillus sp. IB215316 TaxID=3097354 RepID=UPI002A0D689B|nr:M23 family metallopeptidase [Cytobacillus sp. IB215316]MDX8360773.1 M23 family metallopeptidase [Cytobacillus sp. IB215316]
MRRIFLVVIILFLLLPSVALGEDSSVLLNMYGIQTAIGEAEEKQKLDQMTADYRKVSKEVSLNTMLAISSELSSKLNSEKLIEVDKEIYELTDSLQKIEEEMSLSKNREVAYLLQLDASFRATQSSLDTLYQQRSEWLQYVESSQITYKDVEAEKKLIELEGKVEQQRLAYEKATSYEELGEISNFKSPLNRSVFVTSPFGPRLDPVTRAQISTHKGMDMRASTGTSVLAAFNGTIKKANYESAIGNHIIIDHGNGIETLYGHLDRIDVQVGQKVQQYEAIGASGNSGTSTTGPHLHFGVYINGQAVDPAVFIKG